MRNDHDGIGAARDDLLSAFAVNVVAAASDHREVGGWRDVISELSEAARRSDDTRVAVGPTLVAEEPTLVAALRSAGLEVVVPDTDDPAGSVADVPIGLVRGDLAIAETGSVLVSEHSLADRVITMLCARLIQVVHADDVAARLEDLAGWLSDRHRRPAFASLTTGPSRTADIERSLTIGVQGPQEVAVRVLMGPRDVPTGAVLPEGRTR
jgi:L-lactate dehydrogenase complex protein LldG